jgi:CubicO group peptidase (beta-lactamase class C family)
METEKKQRIIRILRIVMPLVAILATVIIAPLDLVPPYVAPLPDTVQAQVDDAVDLGLDGIIVYVDRAGQPPAFYSAGWKNKSTREPADPHALFKIGSIHKLYIATAGAKLVQGGSLALDDTLANLLPEFAGRVENADQITLRMLVQHRSGIPNFTDDEEFDWFAPPADENQSLELVLDDPADFAPDADYSYSNTNYLLLGRILDRVLGYNHHQYIVTEILAPLGLTDTYFTLGEVAFNDLASGYWYGYDDDLRELGEVGSAGSMIATAEDVGVFLRALNDGSLLSTEEQAIYTSIYEYEHTGWVPGYYSIARYHEELDMVFIQFVSTTGGDTWGAANIIGGKATALSNIVYGRIVRVLNR